MTKDETSINVCVSKIIPTLLGVIINNILCWDNHINQVLKKVISSYSCCQELIYILSRKKTNSILHVYILPYLDYCCTSSLEDIIAKFQKRATPFILDRDFKTPPKELFAEPK